MPITYSPLRYPGGKTQMADFVSNLLNINNLNDMSYAEPFAGGCGAGLKLLFKSNVKEIIINDLDVAIYSVWYAILYDTDRFIKDILKTQITIDEWREQKQIYESLRDSKNYNYNLAFATFYLNRTNVSGIISGGPIGGVSQNGKYLIDCRFNKSDLIKKILKIESNKSKIKLYNLEANTFINDVILNYSPDKVFIFFDPPYYNQGKNLYKNYYKYEEHNRLKNQIDTLNEYHWVLTYDNCIEISEMYDEYKQYLYTLNYSANINRKESELFIPSKKVSVEDYNKIKLKNICYWMYH